MAYLQIGAPKSGNFWLYQILQQVLEKSGHSTRSFIEQQPIYKLAKDWELNFPEQARIDVLEVTDLQDRYRISSIFQMPVEDMAAYVAQTAHVWSHSPFCPRSPEVFRHFEKKIYIIRDPRDRLLSAAKYYTSDYMLTYFPQPETDPRKYLQKHFETLMWHWVWHVYDYLRMGRELDIHFVYFENLNRDFANELERLLTYLGAGLKSSQKAGIEEAVSFRKLKKDNPRHLRRGESGYWREQLTAHQAEWATAYAQPLLHLLGYPENEGGDFQLPAPPLQADFEKLKRELIEGQRQLGPLPHA